MAYSQPTQLHLRGAEQINYLSRNVPPFELEDEYIEEFS